MYLKLTPKTQVNSQVVLGETNKVSTLVNQARCKIKLGCFNISQTDI
jgi:hypothetical protein